LTALLYYYSMTAMSQDERPVYLRLRDLIAAMILDGKVSDGDPLPSVRALAAEFGANPLTVAKAYQTFQEEGLIVVRRGIGMFVAQGASARLRESERRDFLDNKWPAVVQQIKRLGFDVEELVDRTVA
jgi:DNA-binding transcriptional regulator YhcF (GntR family)